jgi:predicted nucleic acid-binding protein
VSSVFVDSSGWIALLSADDQHHDRAVSHYDELARSGSRLLTNNYVVDETATRLRYGLGLQAALGFRRMLLGAAVSRRLRVLWIDERSEAEAWRILEQYGDVKLSLTDATCAVTARAARIGEVFGCDSDFEALGFVVLPGRGPRPG